MRDFHKQAIIKQHIEENILARWTGMEYSTGTRFENSLVNMDEEKALTKINQLENHN